VAFIKESYGPEFSAAFQEALAGLPADERALLRLHYGEGVGLTAIGAMYGWSKPTASRQVARARTSLLEAARGRLRARLRVTESDLESLLRVMRSELELTLSSLLREGR
jgi:RNA polymerase sigma-70 factor (ECF subfamily)